VASVVLLLLGFHADALSPLVFGTGFSSPAWLASAVVVTAMWVIVVARIGFRLPISNSVASGGLLIAGIFAWPATQALFSGSLAGATGTAQTLAGLITLLIVASLVSQTNDLRRLSRVTFLVGATASGMILTAMALGVDTAGLGESAVLPVLLVISLLAGLSPGIIRSPVWWGGLALAVAALLLVLTPGLFVVIAVTVFLFLAAWSLKGRLDNIGLMTIGRGLALAALLLAGFLLFNGSFVATAATVAENWISTGTAAFLAKSTSGYGWFNGGVTVLLWGAFISFLGIKAMRLLHLDRQSAAWVFGLTLAVIAAVALSSDYQSLIWLSTAIVVGRHSSVKRVAGFRKRLDLQS
jgi:hypothetical protein